MNKVELRNKILLQIEDISGDEETMQRVHTYISSLKEKSIPTRKISKPNIATNIRNNINIIVPIVCDDMFEYVKADGKVLSIKDFVCEQFDVDDNKEIKNAICSNYYYGISLLEAKEEESLSNVIYLKIDEAIKQGRIRLNRSVKRFLENGDFPIIITTFGFPVIENELGLGEKCQEWYNPYRRNDLPLIKDSNTRLVYHIFGGETSETWAYNEQTLLKFVHSLHSGDYGAKNLSNVFRKHGNMSAKRLLVLGSSLPDWLFRFFVYPMYEDELRDAKGYWLSLDDIEDGLDLFLKRNNYTARLICEKTIAWFLSFLKQRLRETRKTELNLKIPRYLFHYDTGDRYLSRFYTFI